MRKRIITFILLLVWKAKFEIYQIKIRRPEQHRVLAYQLFLKKVLYFILKQLNRNGMWLKDVVNQNSCLELSTVIRFTKFYYLKKIWN